MFNIIESFYSKDEYGHVLFYFVNEHFFPKYQPNKILFSGRKKAYPCYETPVLNLDTDHEIVKYFVKNFEEKSKLKIKKLETFLRKTKKSELKESPIWKQKRPHVDPPNWDYAGVIFMNSNSLKDGTEIYNYESDFEPTAIIGSKYNRCVFYDPQKPHSPSMDQDIDERWVQPFFIGV